MAFFQKARTSSSSSADSFLCPVCNEEYQDEPKQLPCLHTICQDCLCDAATGKNALKIYCPIDGQELPLPMGGIKMLPTDFRVLRLVEAHRGQNKTRSERKPRESRKEKPEKAERKKTRNTDEDSGPPLQEQEERMKKQLSEMMAKLRSLLDEKEKALYKQIDDAMAREKRSLSMNGAEGEQKKRAIFLLDLTPSRKILQSIKEEGLAAIQGNRKAPTLLSELNTAGITPSGNKTATPDANYREAAEVIRALNVPLQFKSMFNPGAVAVGKNGHIAVTDYGNECVWLFNPEGSFLCQIGEDGEGSMECPDGVFFFPDNNIIVSDGPFEGPQSIQMFDITGRFIRSLVEVDDDDEDISFSNISVDDNLRILVTCNGTRPCIQVYNADDKEEYSLEMELGGEHLASPGKAIFFDGKFYVIDSDGSKNKTAIKVFDEKGSLLQTFDEDKHNLGQRDNMGIDITYPIRLALDKSNNTLLAYHGIPREIRILRPDGTQVSSIKTVSGARDIALTIDKKIVATCGEDSILSRSVQMLKFNNN